MWLSFKCRRKMTTHYNYANWLTTMHQSPYQSWRLRKSIGTYPLLLTCAITSTFKASNVECACIITNSHGLRPNYPTHSYESFTKTSSTSIHCPVSWRAIALCVWFCPSHLLELRGRIASNAKCNRWVPPYKPSSRIPQVCCLSRKCLNKIPEILQVPERFCSCSMYWK